MDRQNVRITKSSNHRDSSYRGFCWEIFVGPENFVRIGKRSNCKSSNWMELSVFTFVTGSYSLVPFFTCTMGLLIPCHSVLVF